MNENPSAAASAISDYFQLIPNPLLAAAERGEVDLSALVRGEMAARGLDMQGRWIGCAAAKTLHDGGGEKPGARYFAAA